MSGGLRGGKLASLTGRPARWIGVVTVVSIGLLIWWWPGLTSDPGEVDVELVIGDGLAVADQSIDRRLREEGFMISRTRRPVDWCSVPEALGDMRSESTRLVVWAEATADCDLGDAVDRVVEQARGRRVIVVVLPSDGPMIADAVVGRDIVTVDTIRLLGEPGQTMECVWWEDCPATGTIEPWIDGELGPVGGERVARMIVTATL